MFQCDAQTAFYGGSSKCYYYEKMGIKQGQKYASCCAKNDDKCYPVGVSENLHIVLTRIVISFCFF